MFTKNKLLLKWIFIYLIYVFLFAILLFFVQKPKEVIVDVDDGLYIDGFTDNDDKVALVESGEEGILTRLNLIYNAKETIDISYYTLTGGDSVKLFLAGINDAADRGVKVRIVLDGIFHNLKSDLKPVIYAFEAHPNIELKFYEPFNLLTPRTWYNRLHDKMILVDQKLALIGGRNIGDKYFSKKLTQDKFSKDRDILVYSKNLNTTSSLLKMQAYYDEVFNYQYSKPKYNKLSSRQNRKALAMTKNLNTVFLKYKESYGEKLAFINWNEKTMATDGVQFIYNPIARGNQDPWVLRQLLKLSVQAQESVLIQSPYVILSKDMMTKFGLYDFDFTKMKILTNSMASSPNPVAMAGYYNNKQTIIDSGIDVWEYQGPDSIHSKTYIFDNKISAIGSFNFDARSSYINSEIMVLVESEKFAHNLLKEVEKDLANSLKVKADFTYEKNAKVKAQPVTKLKKLLIWFTAKIVYFIDFLL